MCRTATFHRAGVGVPARQRQCLRVDGNLVEPFAEHLLIIGYPDEHRRQNVEVQECLVHVENDDLRIKGTIVVAPPVVASSD
jgi:hypothetical protein